MSKNETSVKAPLESPRQIVDPVRIPVPLAADGDLNKNQNIIRPTPRRPNEKKAASSERITDHVERKSSLDMKSMTDPRANPKGAMTKSVNTATVVHPVKLNRATSPVSNNIQVPERDVAAKGFVTNVTIEKEATRINVESDSMNNMDMGFQILSSKDEEAEITNGFKNHNHLKASKNGKFKPRRKTERPKLHDHLGPKLKPMAKFKDDSDKDTNINHLLDVKAAIERLKLQTPLDEQASSSSSDLSTSTESDFDHTNNGIAPLRHGPGKKHLSQETLNTSTVTSADEFVWIDSHNRLVELQQIPWTASDIAHIVNKCLEDESGSSAERVTPDVYPRISYYLQRVLVRLAREAQRLSKNIGICGAKEASTALKIVFSPGLATPALRACLRSAAMYSISDASRQSKSERAGLTLKVGKVHQWMCLVKVGKFIHNTAAIYLTAGLETLIEELILKCLRTGNKDCILSANFVEQVVCSNGDFWGMFQTYAHLSSGRLASGTLVLPPCIEAQINSSHKADQPNALNKNHSPDRNAKQILLTTCVGSVDELSEMVLIAGNIFQRMWQSSSSTSSSSSSSKHSYRPISSTGSLLNLRLINLDWVPEAISNLYHFMRCSQLEYVGQDGHTPIQELVYERPYMVLPPIMEWVRVVHAFAEHRQSSRIDTDDVLQAARILLPGMDCPPRSFLDNPFQPNIQDESLYVGEMKKNMAFQMLVSGRKELIPHALQMLPTSTSKLNICNSYGFTPLQVSAMKGDISVCRMLLDTGAAVDATGETGWTPLCYVAITGHYRVARLLLERGARIDGKEDEETETPLQLAAGAGNVNMVELLMSHGASPFKATLPENGLGLPSASKSGNPSPLSIAAIHGHRRLLHIMVTQCLTLNRGKKNAQDDEVLSLAEILAEGVSGSSGKEEDANKNKTSIKTFTKPQIKKLQEAMYHGLECTNVELTLDLRNLGVPWTPYTWVQTLKLAHENQLQPMINELLQDFAHEWLEDHAISFIAEVGLPLLFHIFRTCKNEGTILILADIFALCHGSQGGQKIELKVSTTDFHDPPPRIDSRFVNNPELSDIQFRVEDRVFYAHKLALISASPRFQSMLNSRFCEGNPPVLQINDIRYEIFHLVMTYLYNGGLGKLQVNAGDVLELMAAANFFQLPGLLKHCEVLCAKLVELDNIVSYYIHAKVYSALDLLEFCEAFLLKNMVALLSYDDSVKRLIFGKKLQNHDVLGGLMLNLQKRMNCQKKTS